MRRKRITIALGGTKGVGKTTLANYFKEKMQFRIFNCGLILKELANSYYTQTFELLPIKLRNQLRKKSADYILKHIGVFNLIDLHYGEFEAGIYKCVVPKKINAYFTHLILLTAPSEEILKRRLSDDKSRIRLIDDVIRNIYGEYKIAKDLAKELNIDLFIFENTGTIESTANQIKTYITS